MWSRQTVYTGAQGASASILQQERDAAKSFAQFVADCNGGTGSLFTGLTATPGSGLTVNLAAGALYQSVAIDPTAWSSLAADTSTWLLQGVTTAVTNLAGFAAPGTAGQSINYLVEAQLVQTDTAAVSTAFYNSTTPSNPTYQQKSPSRQNVVMFQVKAGTAATTGSQTTPTADAGWVPLWQVQVNNGQSTIPAGQITLAATAPQFSGFVKINPNGNTPVYLSPGAQQTGFVNISGNITTAGTVIAPNALLGTGAATTTNFGSTFKTGLAGDYASLTSVGYTGSSQATDSLDIAGSIGYTGTHKGTWLLQAPSAPSGITQAAGGSLAATTYYVKQTYVNAAGETTGSAETSFVASASNVITVPSPASVTGTTGWNIYVSNTAGGGSGAETKQNGGTPIAIGTSWAEPTTGLVAGAALPSSNTTSDPYPQSQLNVAMLGGFPASSYALAAGNYVTLYGGAPTLGSGNAGVTGYLQSGVATGTAPLVVASTTMVANLNANYVGGYAAGNASGNIPVSNGTLCTNLNAQYLGGLASSAYQPAGNYAAMNTTNTGNFTVTGQFAATGGSGSTQSTLGYITTNSYGINGGGAMSYVYAASAPLGLIGSSIRTNAPLYVGDGTRQPIYVQDVNANGLVRSGFIPYRVTQVMGYQSGAPYTVPGLGNDYGVMQTLGGAINWAPFGAFGETITWRTILTLNGSLPITMNWRVNDALGVYLDGASKAPTGNGITAFTIPSGTHTIDIVWSGDNISSDDHLMLFPWIPCPGGIVTSTLTSAVPG